MEKESKLLDAHDVCAVTRYAVAVGYIEVGDVSGLTKCLLMAHRFTEKYEGTDWEQTDWLDAIEKFVDEQAHELPLVTRNKYVYSFAEALADIANAAGAGGYYSGDSRADITQFIRWAEEFEGLYRLTRWGEDDNPDYIETIDAFVAEKLKQ